MTTRKTTVKQTKAPDLFITGDADLTSEYSMIDSSVFSNQENAVESAKEDLENFSEEGDSLRVYRLVPVAIVTKGGFTVTKL